MGDYIKDLCEAHVQELEKKGLLPKGKNYVCERDPPDQGYTVQSVPQYQVNGAALAARIFISLDHPEGVRLREFSPDGMYQMIRKLMDRGSSPA